MFHIRAGVVKSEVGRSYCVGHEFTVLLAQCEWTHIPVLWVSAPGCGSVVDDWGNPNQLLCG